MYVADLLVGCQSDCACGGDEALGLSTGEFMSLFTLYEQISDESDDAVDGICHDHHGKEHLLSVSVRSFQKRVHLRILSIRFMK